MTVVADAYLLAPRALPDGRIEWDRQTDIARKLREGDPAMNWEGDASLALVLDVPRARWQVYRTMADGSTTLICSAPRKASGAMPGNELIRALMAHDTRHHDVAADVERHNATIQRERDREAHEHSGAVADKLAWAMGRDLDLPAQSGRLYGLAP